MFLVDDDKTEVAEREEEGATGAEEDLVAVVGVVGHGASPNFGALAGAEA